MKRILRLDRLRLRGLSGATGINAVLQELRFIGRLVTAWAWPLTVYIK
jgi:hypothetical protein